MDDCDNSCCPVDLSCRADSLDGPGVQPAISVYGSIPAQPPLSNGSISSECIAAGERTSTGPAWSCAVGRAELVKGNATPASADVVACGGCRSRDAAPRCQARRSGKPMLGAAGVCAICTMLLWNANARMFIHAYEAMHVFYVTFFLVVAIHLAMRASDTGAWKWWIGAVVACIAATFSFGMGVGSFAAVAIVAVLRRCGRLPLLFIVLSALATFLVYYVVLPGAEGVRALASGPSLQR